MTQNEDRSDNGPGLASASPQTNGVASHTGKTLRFPEICYTLRKKLLDFLEESTKDRILQNVQSQVRVSMQVIEEALQRYEFDQLSLSYNGGKDCLVLLILILACLPTSPTAASSNNTTPNDTPNHTSPAATSTTKNAPAEGAVHAPFQAIYIVPPDPFPEVDDFVAVSVTEYHLDLSRYPLPMREALDAYLAERKSVKAIFMGTRRTDPHGELLTHFTPTDAGWPQFMRVHPVIDWHYAEIWAFIRHLEIPFCSLYNKGFTSLGGTTDTRPNPALAVDGGAQDYRPAYELLADDEERLGRGH